MKLRLRASTGTAIDVWRDGETYSARRVGTVRRPEVCLAVDLFEVIAELADLDLDREDEAAEAIRLAEHSQDQLSDPGEGDEGNGDDPSAASGRRG
jgi:hypothetical protein